jgi:nucleoside-diphosphate-sugar epimerase
MADPAAAGQRFLATDEFLWVADVAAILRERLGDRAGKVPTRVAPNFLVRAMSVFDGSLRSIVGDLGKSASYSNAKARELLGWQPRPVADSIADTAESLLAS